MLEELYADVVTWSRTDTRPRRPISPGSPDSPVQLIAADGDNAARFSAVERASGELAGNAVLWGIDSHNRVAHVGLSLRSAFPGKGLGTDIVRILCRYGFEIRGLHRQQIETLADNHAMISAAKRAGFVQGARCVVPPGSMASSPTRLSPACSPAHGGRARDQERSSRG